MWVGGAAAISDFLYEALVGIISGQHRQHTLETPDILACVAKKGQGNPRCGRLDSQKFPVSPESRSGYFRCRSTVPEVKDAGEAANKKSWHMQPAVACHVR